MTRGKPLDKWEEFLDPEGRVTNPEKIKEIVFRGVRVPSLPACVRIVMGTTSSSSSVGSLSLSVTTLRLLRCIQGIIPSLRKEAWKFLLGFYPWNSTTKEREEILRTKTWVTDPPPPGPRGSSIGFG